MNTVGDIRATPRRLRVNPGYIFIAPALLLIVVLTAFPIYRIIDFSVHKANRMSGVETFVGLDNYINTVENPVFGLALRQTLFFIGFGALGHIGLGFLLALLFNSHLDRKLLNGSRSLILLPWVLSPVVVAILSQLWMHPLISPIAKVLQSLGWTGVFEPLGQPKTALTALAIMNIWQYTPFYMLMILVGLQTLDAEQDDAAKVDGADYPRRLYYVVWPHIRNVVLTFTLFDLVANAAYFDLIWVATKGGPVRSTEVLATFLYRTAFLSLDWNVASVVAIALLVLSIMLAISVVLLLRRD